MQRVPQPGAQIQPSPRTARTRVRDRRGQRAADALVGPPAARVGDGHRLAAVRLDLRGRELVGRERDDVVGVLVYDAAGAVGAHLRVEGRFAGVSSGMSALWRQADWLAYRVAPVGGAELALGVDGVLEVVGALGADCMLDAELLVVAERGVGSELGTGLETAAGLDEVELSSETELIALEVMTLGFEAGLATVGSKVLVAGSALTVVETRLLQDREELVPDG